MIESFASTGLMIPPGILASLKDGGFLLPWELKRRILGLRGSGMCYHVIACLECSNSISVVTVLHSHQLFHSEWVPIVLAYAQESWGVRMELNWRHDTSNHSDDGHRQGVIDTFWKAWEIQLNELCSMVEACAGATELVEGLRALHIPMAIATSSRIDSVSKKKLR